MQLKTTHIQMIQKEMNVYISVRKGNNLLFDATALCVFFNLENNTKHKEEQKTRSNLNFC